LDSDRFDALLRSLSTRPTRRRVAHLLSGTVLAGLLTLGAMPADAKKGGTGKGKGKGAGNGKGTGSGKGTGGGKGSGPGKGNVKPCKDKEKVTICHNGQTMSVSRCVLKRHQEHGDTVGACSPPKPPTGCSGGMELCGGQCVPPCGSGSVRNLATCGCCFETGVICDESGNTPCCNAEQDCDAVCCLSGEKICAGLDDTSCCPGLSCQPSTDGFRCESLTPEAISRGGH
jgi:hypothetical protein